MDYLVSRLKANGIYVSLDLFTLRQVRRDEVIPGTIGTDEYKALLLVDQTPARTGGPSPGGCWST